MTAFDYGRSRQSADRLIRRYGQPANLLRPTSTGPGWNPTPGEPDEFGCVAAVLDYDNREIDGRVLATDKKIMVSAEGLGVAPGLGDRLVIGEATYSIIRCSPLAPGGVDVVYTLQCRC